MWVRTKCKLRLAKDPKPEGSRSAHVARLCNREKARHMDVIGRLGVEIIIEPAPRCPDIRAHRSPPAGDPDSFYSEVTALSCVTPVLGQLLGRGPPRGGILA